MARVLLIEDDAPIRIALTRALTTLGHAVETAPTGAGALAHVIRTAPELVVLDLGLPDIDGQAVLRMLRADSDVPVIVATARDDDVDVVATLNAGADDYLVKPFTGRQLDARIRAVLRRAGDDRPPAPLQIGQLQVDARTRQVRLEGRCLELSAKEFDVLLHLAERAGAVVSKQELLAQVWRQPASSGTKTVDVHLSWLRRKLGESGQAPRYLHTVRGAGVRLAPPAT